VLVLRYKEPERPRPFRVPMVWLVTVLSAAGCLFIMQGLPKQAWERFGYWLVIGLHLYFSYGFIHSCCRPAEEQSERIDMRLLAGWTTIALLDCAGATLSALGISWTFVRGSYIGGIEFSRHGVDWAGGAFWSVMLVIWMWVGWQQTRGTGRSRPTQVPA